MPKKPHRRQSDKPKLRFESIALGGTTFFSFLLLLVSVPGLFPDATDSIWIKAAILAPAGALVSYAINRFAIERGASLAVLGYPIAGYISAAGILTIGIGLFAMTYAGLTLPGTARLQLQETLNQRSGYVAALNAETVAFQDTAAAARAASTDLNQSAACELATSCISGRGAGGNGPVYRATSAIAGRAQSIVAEIEAADVDRVGIVLRLNAEFGSFRDALQSEEGTVWDRFQSVQVIDARLLQAGEELVRSMPVALLSSYSAELSNGMTIPGRPEASATLSRIMRGHGVSIGTALEEVSEARADRPMAEPFPVRPGVGDTFRYIGHFWPVAVIALIVELILPISLWLYTLLNLHWIAERDIPKVVRPEKPAKPFTHLIDYDPDESADVRHQTPGLQRSGDDHASTSDEAAGSPPPSGTSHLNGRSSRGRRAKR